MAGLSRSPRWHGTRPSQLLSDMKGLFPCLPVAEGSSSAEESLDGDVGRAAASAAARPAKKTAEPSARSSNTAAASVLPNDQIPLIDCRPALITKGPLTEHAMLQGLAKCTMTLSLIHI